MASSQTAQSRSVRVGAALVVFAAQVAGGRGCRHAIVSCVYHFIITLPVFVLGLVWHLRENLLQGTQYIPTPSKKGGRCCQRKR
jgi:hypothetical protein